MFHHIFFATIIGLNLTYATADWEIADTYEKVHPPMGMPTAAHFKETITFPDGFGIEADPEEVRTKLNAPNKDSNSKDSILPNKVVNADNTPFPNSDQVKQAEQLYDIASYLLMYGDDIEITSEQKRREKREQCYAYGLMYLIAAAERYHKLAVDDIKDIFREGKYGVPPQPERAQLYWSYVSEIWETAEDAARKAWEEEKKAKEALKEGTTSPPQKEKSVWNPLSGFLNSWIPKKHSYKPLTTTDDSEEEDITSTELDSQGSQEDTFGSENTLRHRHVLSQP